MYCNALDNCDIRSMSTTHPRLLTHLVYLNPDYKPSDGGAFKIYQGGLAHLQETLWPTMGSGILFRADRLVHSAEMVFTKKRAISLYIHVKARKAERD